MVLRKFRRSTIGVEFGVEKKSNFASFKKNL